MGQLTRKERMMLQEQLGHEQVCVSKYRSYAGRASPAVREMFNEFARDEQNHYDTLNRLLDEGKERFHDAGQELAATSDGRFVPVDTFGRQAGPEQGPADSRAWNWTNQSLTFGRFEPGPWQSTARQILFERERAGAHPAAFRGHQWGGLLPGDVPDTNHGDLTRGGLDRRGVDLAEAGDRSNVPEGFPPPGHAAHVMPSHLESDGEHTARIWGEPDKGAPRVGSLRTEGWPGGSPSESQWALNRTIKADEERLAGLRTIGGATQQPGDGIPFGDDQDRFQGQLGWAHRSTPWYGPSGEPYRSNGAWSRSLVRPSGPVSLPPVKMEVAEEWDGVNPSPWSELTSPVPMDSGTWPRLGPGNTVGSPGTVTASADDRTMLTDMLMTERFVSGAYDSAVFDSASPAVRQTLQQIQRDEQRHGERIRGSLHNPPD